MEENATTIELAMQGAAVWTKKISDEVYNDTYELIEFYRSGQLKNATGNSFSHFARAMELKNNYNDESDESESLGEDKPALVAGRFIEDYFGGLIDVDGVAQSGEQKYWVFNKSLRPDISGTMAKKENKAWKEALELAANGATKVEADQIKCLHHILPTEAEAVILAKIKAPDTDQQVTMLWTDPDTGIKLRARTDFTRPQTRTIIDFKTMREETDQKFLYAVRQRAYKQQALQQIEGARQTGYMAGTEPIKYFWVGISKVEPYNIVIVEYSNESQKADYDSIFRHSVNYAARYEALKNEQGGKIAVLPNEPEFLTI